VAAVPNDYTQAAESAYPPRLNDMDERRIRSVVCEWLNEAEVEDAQALARKIAANLRPTIDASLAMRYSPGAPS
jgi:outer membrane protein TolC